MANSTAIQNIRTDRRIEQLKDNAEVTAQAATPGSARRFWILPVAAAFMLMLTGIGAVSAAELNLSFIGEMFTSLFTALTDVLPPFEAFVDEGFPVLIKVIVYVAVIGVIGLGLYAMRSIIERIIKMIGF